MTSDSLYERLYMRGYRRETLGDVKTMAVRDAECVEAYQLLRRMRAALILCADVFNDYAKTDEPQLEGHLSLVERQAIELRIAKHQQIALHLNQICLDHPAPVEHGWLPIDTAAQDRQPIRLLGKYDDGRTYVETGYWDNIQWSVQAIKGARPPTHWAPLEARPEGYY